jgi:Kunitz/Bovine pancreatic trypsin inhibitor domain
MAEFHNFYYDSASGQCKEFIYGGCDGNENRLKKIGECQKACQKIDNGNKERPHQQ